MMVINSLLMLLLAKISYAIIIKEQMCGSLKKLEDESKKLLENTNCSINSNCTQLYCKGKYKDKSYEMAADLKICDQPPKLILSANLPQFNIFLWKYSFTENGPVNVPVSNLPEKFENSSLQINFTRSKEHFKLVFTVQGTELYKQEFDIPIKECHLNNINDLPSGASKDFYIIKNTKRTCLIGNLSACSYAEECSELIKDSLQGECHCIPGYHVNQDLTCIIDPASDPQNGSRHSNTTSYVLMGIFIPLVLIILGGLLIFVNKRYNLISQFRRATRRYDEVLLDQSINNFDDDDEQPLA